jgi:hypothetical protein
MLLAIICPVFTVPELFVGAYQVGTYLYPIKQEPDANGRRQLRFCATGEIGVSGHMRYPAADIGVQLQRLPLWHGRTEKYLPTGKTLAVLCLLSQIRGNKPQRRSARVFSATPGFKQYPGTSRSPEVMILYIQLDCFQLRYKTVCNMAFPPNTLGNFHRCFGYQVSKASELNRCLEQAC